MNQFTVLVADTLQVVSTSKCYPDTIICSVISLQDISQARTNWTLVIISAMTAVVLLTLIGTNYCLQKRKLHDEAQKRVDQHQWEVENDERGRWYKYQDILFELKKVIKENDRFFRNNNSSRLL